MRFVWCIIRDASGRPATIIAPVHSCSSTNNCILVAAANNPVDQRPLTEAEKRLYSLRPGEHYVACYYSADPNDLKQYSTNRCGLLDVRRLFCKHSKYSLNYHVLDANEEHFFIITGSCLVNKDTKTFALVTDCYGEVQKVWLGDRSMLPSTSDFILTNMGDKIGAVLIESRQITDTERLLFNLPPGAYYFNIYTPEFPYFNSLMKHSTYWAELLSRVENIEDVLRRKRVWVIDCELFKLFVLVPEATESCILRRDEFNILKNGELLMFDPVNRVLYYASDHRFFDMFIDVVLTGTKQYSKMLRPLANIVEKKGLDAALDFLMACMI